ncbi:hypothetical protein BRE01_50270 [Brevibacillus reuszeri]|uniref:Uncharacterized protein n=1 Tax=Brevibacillus reuszeri TaxID=54915 RepID=A0A0K9YLP3_9BACL|nr:hypothetical protein [Brevibacillus reuszeri]KNB69614.1 hypothetical protein ADS79_27540 [Brevibacillus reuszeri]MED1856011.1 hypothetical protein [Brevibacillus reuszeri]GED71325.1 hypothetical protein BRE01_50270 [Brevibacillus reuszeri]
MWETQLRNMLNDQAETIQQESTVANEVMTKIQSGTRKRMKGRKRLLIGLISCSILIFTGGVYADQLYHYWKTPRSAEEVKKTEELNKELEAKRESVDEAIAKAFGISLTNYSSIDANGLFKSETVHPLLPIVSDIMDQQQINDRKPSVYMNAQTEQEGYIFEDKTKSYVVHMIKKDEAGEWQIVSVQEMQKKE